MSTFRMLERKMMQRASLADNVTDDKYIGEMIEQMRLHAQQEFEKEMKNMQSELSDMRIRMGRVESLEVECDRLRKHNLEVKLEAQKRVEESQKQVGEVQREHQAIHAQHNSTIKEQQTLILKLQEQIKCMGEDYSKHSTESIASAADKSRKEIKDCMAQLMSDMRKSMQENVQANKQVQAKLPSSQRATPVVDFEVVRDGNGLIRKFVAKPH